MQATLDLERDRQLLRKVYVDRELEKAQVESLTSFSSLSLTFDDPIAEQVFTDWYYAKYRCVIAVAAVSCPQSPHCYSCLFVLV